MRRQITLVFNNEFDSLKMKILQSTKNFRTVRIFIHSRECDYENERNKMKFQESMDEMFGVFENIQKLLFVKSFK